MGAPEIPICPEAEAAIIDMEDTSGNFSRPVPGGVISADSITAHINGESFQLGSERLTDNARDAISGQVGSIAVDMGDDTIDQEPKREVVTTTKTITPESPISYLDNVNQPNLANKTSCSEPKL